MKLRWLVVWVVVCCGVAGCGSNKPAAPVAPKVVVRESVVATILTCVQENRGLSRQDQRSAYADLDKQFLRLAKKLQLLRPREEEP